VTPPAAETSDAPTAEDAKKAAIAAAIARAKALKAAATEPQPADAQTPNSDVASPASPSLAADDAKQAAIAAAIARAKAQKAAAQAAGAAPKNVDDASPTVKQEIADIEARRLAVGLIDKSTVATEVNTLPATAAPLAAADADAEKQAKIAAAIARAKAAKAAAEQAKLESPKE
ncbi:MAG TPA: hypothetical protein VGD04_07915, partial [Methylophilus sp.]